MSKIDAQTLYEAMDGIGEDLLMRSESASAANMPSEAAPEEKKEAAIVRDRFGMQTEAFDRRRRAGRARRTAVLGALAAAAALFVFTVPVMLRKSTMNGTSSVQLAYEESAYEESAEEASAEAPAESAGAAESFPVSVKGAESAPAREEEAGDIQTQADAVYESAGEDVVLGRSTKQEVRVLVRALVRALLKGLSGISDGDAVHQ